MDFDNPFRTTKDKQGQNQLSFFRKMNIEILLTEIKMGIRSLNQRQDRMEKIMSALNDKLDELAAKLGGLTDAVPAAVALLDGIHAEVVALRQEVADSADIPAALARIDDFESTLASRTQELAEATVRNTDLTPPEGNPV